MPSGLQSQRELEKSMFTAASADKKKKKKKNDITN